MAVEVHVDYSKKSIVVYDLDLEKEIHAPGAILKDVTITPDRQGAIVTGDLVEVVTESYHPRSSRFRAAKWAMSGRVVDRQTETSVDSCSAAIVNGRNVYYVR